MTTRVDRVGFSNAFHAALDAYARGGEYSFVDSYEYDFLDDFTRKTSRIRVVSVRFTSNYAILKAVETMMAALLRAGICAERIFYRIEEPDEEGIQVKMWGMKELALESPEAQEASSMAKEIEIMRVEPGSIIQPGVEIWYKGELRFRVEGDKPYIVGTPILAIPGSDGIPLSLAVEDRHGTA